MCIGTATQRNMHGTCLHGACLELMMLISWFHNHSIQTYILKQYLVDCNVNYFEENFTEKKKHAYMW